MVAQPDSYLFDSSFAAGCFYRILGPGPVYIFPILNMDNVKKKIKPGWKLAALVLSIPLFILITEIILTIIPVNTYFQNRFFLVNRALDYPEVFKKDKDLFWRLRHDQKIKSKFFEGKTYRINSQGLRGEEIGEKANNVRIVALGNSCTFGWGIEYNNIYTEKLENLINSDPDLPAVQVINAGIPGYSSFQGRRFFNSDILKLEPDIVLLMYGWNDQWAAAGNIPDDRQEMPPEIIIDLQNTFSRLEIYRLIKKITLSVIEEPLDAKLDRENPVYRVGTVEYYNNLTVMVKQAKGEDIIPICLTSPIPSLDKYYPEEMKYSPMHIYHKQYNEMIRLIKRNFKTPVIDLATEFDKYDDLYDDAQYDPIHFNRKGHEVAASAIYKYLKETKILKNIQNGSNIPSEMGY